MSVCGSCGAMRLEQWTTCPFCGLGFHPPDGPIVAADDAATPAMGLPPTANSDIDSNDDDVAAAGPAVIELAELGDGAKDQVEETLMPAPVVAALALVAVILVGIIGYFALRGESPSPGLAMVDSATATTFADQGVDEDSSVQAEPQAPSGPVVDTIEPVAVLGPELASQLQAICAGDQTALAGAPEASKFSYNEMIAVTFDPSIDGWTDPSDQPVYSSLTPSLVRCDSIADAETIFFCDDYEDGYSYAGVASDWSSRLIQTVDGTVLDESSGRNENVGDCPDSLTVYDNTKEIVARAGIGPTGLASAAQYPSAAEPECSRPSPSGLQVIAANNPALAVPVPASWIGSTNEAAVTMLCVGHRAEIDRNDVCQTIVSANAFGDDGTLLNSWSYVHGNCDWSTELPMPPAEWFQNIVGPALGYPPA